MSHPQDTAVFDDSKAEFDTTDNLSEVTVVDLFDDGSVDSVYRAKSHLISAAIQATGMGKYQKGLFITAGFGWFSDSAWPILSGLILTPALNEFQDFRAPYLSFAANLGFLVGAVVWSFGCDIWGRRWSYNLTLLLTGIFGLAAGGSPNFVTLASLFAVLGVGVGGNMPVDSAVFLDFVPGTHQYLLTILAVWWAIGQLLASLVAWPLIGNFSCQILDTNTACPRSENMGWRYLLFALGGLTLLMWAIRFFAFPLYESPRYLLGKGKDREAVEVVHKLADYNGKKVNLTVEMLEEAGRKGEEKAAKNGEKKRKVLSESSNWTWDHIKALFATKKMAFSTSVLIALWGIIGLASTLYNSFLPFLLATKGAEFGDASLYISYRNNVILSVLGVPGAFLSGYFVEVPYLGRRGTLSASAVLTGVFLFASTTARTSDAVLGWNCGYSFFSNMMYGVLYACSAEIFPAKDRGTGNGLVSTATRVFGVIGPVIALYANISTAVPVYIAGALIMLAGFLTLALPFEPRGKTSI